MRFGILPAVFLGLFPLMTWADSPANGNPEPKTVMAAKGNVILNEPFSKTLGPEWKIAKGTWAVADGSLKGTENPTDMHAAVLRHDLKLHDLVATYSFRFDGGKMTAFSLNDPKGHVCRVSITPTGFSLAKDKPNKNSEVKGKTLDKVAMAPGQWYTITVELCGDDFVAAVDDTHVAFGSAEGLDIDKSNFGFPIAGAGVSLKDLTIWQATAKADWEQTKVKLSMGKTKTDIAK